MKRAKFVKSTLVSLALVFGAIALSESEDAAEAAAVAAETPIYTEEQAEVGAGVYQQSCVACHFSELQGDDFAAALAGRNFLNYWSGRTVEEFHSYIKTFMPLGAGGTLSDEAYAAVVAYILHYNEFPAGETELPENPAELAGATFGNPAAE